MAVTEQERKMIKKYELALPRYRIDRCRAMANGNEDDYADYIFDEMRAWTMCQAADNDPDTKYQLQNEGW